jgi:hypothetical protein
MWILLNDPREELFKANFLVKGGDKDCEFQKGVLFG